MWSFKGKTAIGATGESDVRGGGARSEIIARVILAILERPCVLVDCVSKPVTCEKAETCAARDIWSLLGHNIDEFLSYCGKRRIQIERAFYFNSRKKIHFFPNVFADVGVFLMTKG